MLKYPNRMYILYVQALAAARRPEAVKAVTRKIYTDT